MDTYLHFLEQRLAPLVVDVRSPRDDEEPLDDTPSYSLYFTVKDERKRTTDLAVLYHQNVGIIVMPCMPEITDVRISIAEYAQLAEDFCIQYLTGGLQQESSATQTSQ